MDHVEHYVLTHPSYGNIHKACKEVFIPAIDNLEHKPDFIVGLSRGGLIPATVLSHMTDIPLFPVKYSSKSGNGDNKNHDNELPAIAPWFSKDELGEPLLNVPTLLIMDDISDSGNTLREVSDHYRSKGHRVYTAALYYKELTNAVIVPDIIWNTIPEDFDWIIFPWERD